MSKRRHMFVTSGQPRLGLTTCGAESKLTGTKVCQDCRDISDEAAEEQMFAQVDSINNGLLAHMQMLLDWVGTCSLLDLSRASEGLLDAYLSQSPMWRQVGSEGPADDAVGIQAMEAMGALGLDVTPCCGGCVKVGMH